MYAICHRTPGRAEERSASTTLTAVVCSAASCATADAVATGIDSLPSKSVRVCACRDPSCRLLETRPPRQMQVSPSFYYCHLILLINL